MRAALLALLLAACAEHGPSPSPAEVDATPSAFERCEAPAGTASITAAHQDLQPQYARMYAGGIFTGGGDSGGPPGFDLRMFFSNEALTTAPDVIACEGGASCTSVGFLVDVLFQRGDELGVHAATIRDSAATWQASGTVTLTDVVYPENVVGHVAGSIHVDSTVTIDGSFDHVFCPGLLEATL